LGRLLTAFFLSSIGLFFMSTFFSKHQIRLISQMIPVNVVCIRIIGLGLLFTTLYRMRFSYIMLRRRVKIRLSSGIPSIVSFSIGLLAFASVGYGNFARSCLLRSVFFYEIPINYIIVVGGLLFLYSINTLSRNMAKRMLQIDTIIDTGSKVRSAIAFFQSTDIGYGRVEYKPVTESVNTFSRLIVGIMERNRVNLRVILIRLCLVLLFLY